MSERKLKAWEAAGLIDAATAARIRAWEADHSRPLGLWAVIGLAALAIGLGLISVVAANWDAIPGLVRLAIHFAVMAGLAGWLWLRGTALARDHPWGHEAAVFVLGMLGLTFMGHLGQVYQTSSPLWQPVGLWLLLFAPLLLGRGLGWLSAAMVMVAAVFVAWGYAIHQTDLRPEPAQPWLTLRTALVVAAPALLAGVAARQASRPAFWRRIKQLAVVFALGGASLCAIVSVSGPWHDDPDASYMLLAAVIVGAVGLVSAALIRSSGPDRDRQMAAAIMAGSAAMPVIAYVLSGNDIVAALLFMALWAGVAAAALVAGWRGVFQLAVAVIALRLIVLSFELAGDLLTSGAGLIASGLMILAIAWGAVRISRRFAPAEEDRP